MIDCELTGGGGGGDHLRGVPAVVASHQNDPTRRVPGRVSQSELLQGHVVLGPAPAILAQLQAISGGTGIYSTTKNVPGQGVPNSGTARDGGEREGPLGGWDEELCLVVCCDQNT